MNVTESNFLVMELPKPPGTGLDWRWVWRDGLAELLPDAGLLALRDALVLDDPALVQGTTVQPPPFWSNSRLPVECGCPVAYALWKSGSVTVGAVAGYFRSVLRDAERKLGVEEATRSFLNWFDDTPRALAIEDLLIEVEAEMERRGDVPQRPEAPAKPERQSLPF